MLSVVKSVVSILLSHGLLLLANGMFGTLLGIRASLEEISTEITGLIMAGFFLGLLSGSRYAIYMIASVGHIRAFAAFASIMSVSVLAHILYIEALTWFFMRVISGFCMAGMIMIVESWLNERAENKTRGRILSIYMMTNYFGAGIGQFVLLVAHPAEFQLFVIVSIIFSIALVPILLTQAKAPKLNSLVRIQFKELVRISPLGIMGIMCAGMMNSSILTMGALFAAGLGLSIVNISILMACFIFSGMVLQFPIGRLSDYFDRRMIMLCVTSILVVLSLVMVWATKQTLLYLFIIGAIFGGFAFTVYPMSVAQLNDLTDPKKRVQVSSGVLISFGIGAVLGPIIASQMMGNFGPEGMFYFIAIDMALLTLFGAFRILVRDRGDVKSSFLPLGNLGLSSKQLYAETLAKSDQKGR